MVNWAEEDMISLADLSTSLKPGKPPGLRRGNGTGTTILGSFVDPRLAPAYFSMVWLTIVFVPVIPFGIFLVSSSSHGYRFYGRISARDFARLYPGKLSALVSSVMGEAVMMFVVVIAVVIVVSMLFSGLRMR